MITEWFMTLAQGVVTWALGLLPPTDTAQDLIVSAENAFAPIIAGASQIGGWMPWGTLAICFPIVIGFYVASFAVKVFRQLFAHVPLFGGTG